MELKPLRFGSVNIEFPVMLAPMAGYTDAAMRTLCLEQGAGAVYTELASSEGLSRDGGKTFSEVLDLPWSEHPIAGHIFGADPQRMAEAARIIEQDGRFDWIDLNCGCPVKKVVSRGAGAALLKDLPLMGRIIEAIRSAVSLPVSVKTRIGFNQDTADHLEIGRVVEQSGADLIAVHARLAKDFHGGDPDWEKLGEMKRALTIPVIGNGGVFSAEDALRMVEVSGVDGVMIGRGAIGNPWIFKHVSSLQSEADVEKIGLTPFLQVTSPQRSQRNTEACNNESLGSSVSSCLRGETELQEWRDMMAEHLRRLVELNELKQKASSVRVKRYTPEEAACIQFRTHIPYYVKGMFDKKQLLMKLASLMSVDAIMEEIDMLVSKNNKSPCRGAESAEG